MFRKTLSVVIVLFALSTPFFAQDSLSVVPTQEAQSLEPENRNTTTIGYQIGGLTLIGIDYEMRLHDNFGVHFGAGLLGYTAGIKIHSKPDKNSSFFNLSFKDAGMGEFRTVGVEYGGKWVFNKEKSDFGLVFQVGIAAITTISDEFKEKMYPEVDTPPATLTVGVGFGF